MKWIKRLKLMRISKAAIIICLILTVTMAGFTIYGNNVGNFIISTDNRGAQLSLSMTEDFSDKSARIAVPGLREQDAATFTDIPKNITEGIGCKNDFENRRYLASSFYLTNESDHTIEYTAELSIVEANKGTENAVRVMLIENDNEYGDIYAMPETTEEGRKSLELHTDYATKDFVAQNTVLLKKITGFEAGATVKYTVVIWLEGWDVDCNDGILKGNIKMKLDFAGY